MVATPTDSWPLTQLAKAGGTKGDATASPFGSVGAARRFAICGLEVVVLKEIAEKRGGKLGFFMVFHGFFSILFRFFPSSFTPKNPPFPWFFGGFPSLVYRVTGTLPLETRGLRAAALWIQAFRWSAGDVFDMKQGLVKVCCFVSFFLFENLYPKAFNTTSLLLASLSSPGYGSARGLDYCWGEIWIPSQWWEEPFPAFGCLWCSSV